MVLKIGVDQPMGGGSDPGKLAERVCGFTCVGAFARKKGIFPPCQEGISASVEEKLFSTPADLCLLAFYLLA